jgi:hypothetical protein
MPPSSRGRREIARASSVGRESFMTDDISDISGSIEFDDDEEVSRFTIYYSVQYNGVI